jgi:hypothetical protein
MAGKSPFARLSPERSYRRLFVIGTEGRVTERRYFLIVKRLYPDSNCVLEFSRTSSSNCSNPHEVLESVKRWIKENGPLGKGDEAWLVVDTDAWTEEQLNELRNWVSEAAERRFGRGLALSDPKFEYWLLLHFENAGVRSSRECTDKLKRHLPYYDKDVSDHDFSHESIEQAMSTARQRDGHGSGPSTTVYKLVESILSRSES